MAKIYDLPVVYVCQDNQYSISSRSTQFHSWDSLATWAAGYNIPSTRVDGNDALAVRAEVDAGIERARNGGGPTFIDALTFRMGGHLSTDKALYQADDEKLIWENKDPIKNLEKHMLKELGITNQEVSAFKAKVQARILEAWATVISSESVTLESK